MVCSSCGQERPDGDRFCGTCGTPLPHPRMGAAGAESTLSFTRVSLESFSSRDRVLATHVGTLGMLRLNSATLASEEPPAEPPAQAPAIAEMVAEPPASLAEPLAHSTEVVEEVTSAHSDFTPASEEVVAEPSLPDVAESPNPVLANPSPEPPASEAPPMPQRDVSEFLDELATAPAEPLPSHEAPHFPWMDGVLEQIDQEAAKSAKSSAQEDERPRFLDLLGDLSQPPTAEQAPVPPAVAASIPEEEASAEKPTLWRDAVAPPPSPWKRRIWPAAAVAAVLIALVIVQWRSQLARNSGGLEERIADKIYDLANGGNADAKKDAGASADPIDLSNPPAQSSQSQPASKPQPDNGASGGRTQATNPATANAPPPASKAGQQNATSAEDIQEESPMTGPGAREMMRAKQAKTVAGRSEWLWKATAKGNPEAPVQLAQLYMSGEGVPRSCEQALVLLKTAAQGNNALACNRLASLYATGTCVPQSQLEAYRWFGSALAADPNNRSAQQQRDALWKQMTPEERSLAQESH